MPGILTAFTLRPGANGEQTFIPSAPTYIDARDLAANTNETHTVPTGAEIVLVFGLLEYWWFGEHGQPRLDYSNDVYFTTDELATRFIEEIDFDYQDLGATSSLQTAAS